MLRASHFMPRSLLRLRHPHRNRYSLTAPLGAQRNSCQRTDKEAALRWLADQHLIERSTDIDRARLSSGRRPADNSHPQRAEKTRVHRDSPTAALAVAILAEAVPADDTPARIYLARRGTWPPAGSGPDLPATVRWLPADVAEQIRPHDGNREWRVKLPTEFVAGAVVYKLGRPGQPPDVVELEAVSADGQRRDQVPVPPPPPPQPWTPKYFERCRKTYGSKRERVFEVPAVPGEIAVGA